MAPFYGYFADTASDFGVGHGDDGARGDVQRESERGAIVPGDGRLGTGAIQMPGALAAEWGVGIDASQDEICIRDGRFAATAAITGRPRIGTSTLRSDL